MDGAERLARAVTRRRELMQLDRRRFASYSGLAENTVKAIEDADRETLHDDTLFALDRAFDVDGGTSRAIWRGEEESYPPPLPPWARRIAERIAMLRGDDIERVSLLVSALSSRQP